MIFLRNLLRARARSLTTVLGIAAGITLFAASAAVTSDLRDQIAGAVQAYQFDVVIHEKRAASPLSSRITRAQMDALVQRYGQALSPMVMGTLNEKWSSYALVVGVTPTFAQRIPLIAGLKFTPGQHQVMLGEIGAQRLHLGPGDAVSIAGESYRISGIYRTGSRAFDGGLMGEIPDMQRAFTQEGTEPGYTMALLSTGSREATDRSMAEVASAFPALKAIPGAEFAGALRLFRVVDAFVGTITLVVLIGTALVVTNMLMMALSERTRDIGILMAVGWTPALVLRMLAAETVVLSAAGVALGNLGAIGLLRVLNNLENVGFGWLPVRLAPALVGQSVLLMAVVALVSLVWPAAVLWRMKPLTALRHE